MKSCELVSLITAVSCTIANCVPKEEIPLIASVLGQIAATLATITIQEKALSPEQIIPDIVPDTPLLSEETNSAF